MADVTVINRGMLQRKVTERVCAYCRVSRNTDDQLNSYARQIRVYTDMIKRNPDWELVEIFADEGITGTSADKRPEFLRMIKDCELHKIDRIITKSVSRFARNVKEALLYVRKLKLLGIGVQFEKEGIYTLSMGDEMLLNTFAAIAEEESVEISIRLRNANTKRMADGDFVDGNAPYGFRLVDRKLVEYKPEADIIRRIFSDYLSGKSTHEIARLLNEDRIPSRKNTLWKGTAIRYILKNEKYKGDFLCQKTYHTSVLPFRQKRNYGDEDQYYIKDSHEGIISRDDFDLANEIMEQRKEYQKTDAEYIEYPFTSMIVCPECGSSYIRKKSRGGIYWACTKHLESRDLCPSHYIREIRIQEAYITMVNKLRFSGTDIINDTVSAIEKAIETEKRANTQAFDMSRKISELTAKLLMLEQLKGKGYLTVDVYLAQSKELTSQISRLKGERSNMLVSELSEPLTGLKELSEMLKTIDMPVDRFDEKQFRKIVERIEIGENENAVFVLKGGLKFTEPL